MKSPGPPFGYCTPPGNARSKSFFFAHFHGPRFSLQKLDNNITYYFSIVALSFCWKKMCMEYFNEFTRGETQMGESRASDRETLTPWELSSFCCLLPFTLTKKHENNSYLLYSVVRTVNIIVGGAIELIF